MTYTEFSIEFDKLYNNLATSGAPGVDPFEKSLFLTEAQEDIVKAIMTGSPKISVLNKTFEIDEDVRRSLSNISKQLDTSSVVLDAKGINPTKSYIADYDVTDFDKIWWITLERAYITDTKCNKSKWTKVVPTTHDEYNEMINDPFMKPDNHIVWRLDINIQSIDSVAYAGKYGVELISDYIVEKYRMRYLEKPSPIIVEDLQAGTPLWRNFYIATATLTVDGEHTPATCELNSKIHRVILYKAVELAMAAYKDGSLGTMNKINQGIT